MLQALYKKKTSNIHTTIHHLPLLLPRSHLSLLIVQSRSRTPQLHKDTRKSHGRNKKNDPVPEHRAVWKNWKKLLCLPAPFCFLHHLYWLYCYSHTMHRVLWIGGGDPVFQVLLFHSQNRMHCGRTVIRVLWMAEGGASFFSCRGCFWP